MVLLTSGVASLANESKSISNFKYLKLNLYKICPWLPLYHPSRLWVAEPWRRHPWCFLMSLIWLLLLHIWRSNASEYLISLHPGFHLGFNCAYVGWRTGAAERLLHRWLGRCITWLLTAVAGEAETAKRLTHLNSSTNTHQHLQKWRFGLI